MYKNWVFVVGINGVNEKHIEQLADVLREDIMEYAFVHDVMDYEEEEETTDIDRKKA